MTEHYVRDFQAFASNGAAGAPAWLREIREGAIARFAELGFPTMKQEAWRFTSVAPPPAPGGGVAGAGAGGGAPPLGGGGGRSGRGVPLWGGWGGGGWGGGGAAPPRGGRGEPPPNPPARNPCKGGRPGHVAAVH